MTVSEGAANGDDAHAAAITASVLTSESELDERMQAIYCDYNSGDNANDSTVAGGSAEILELPLADTAARDDIDDDATLESLSSA